MRRRLAGLLLALPLLGHPGGVSAQKAADTKSDIAALLDALKAAPNETTAGLIEDRLQRIWLRSGTAVTTLLMSRGLRSLKAEQYDEAIGCFTDAITVQPDLAEAWHQRAVARYQVGDVNGAIQDLRQTVQLEPRNFLAFKNLTDIAAARDDWKGAYAAWQKVLEIDPMTEGAQDRLRDLKRKALGEEL
jgi:tetratricopeptide (TPR) repeat protein